MAGRRRRVYRLTPLGRTALEHRRADWRDFAAAVGAVLDRRSRGGEPPESGLTARS
jgi:DNA-binding PadR family transcriptional regulator